MEEYYEALKRGQRRYHMSLAKGEYPYLPVLDDILSYSDVASSVSLGTMDIPLEKLVGTKTAERSQSFANNFMPLLGEKTEFAAKWTAVYEHQVADGIQDPIEVYEFMNRFYVQEGNKRVSVMKFVGAYSIPGRVTRLLPKKSDDREIKLYYEFLDFYGVSKNCDVWFSREGSYRRLLNAMGKEPGQVWDGEEQMFFRSAYGRFAKAFQMAHGEKLELTASDAFLVYIEIYGYDQVKGQTEREMYQSLRKIWDEIRLADKGNQIELIRDPKEEGDSKRLSLRNWFLPVNVWEPEEMKIGFIYEKTPKTSSWTYAHELGRLHLEQASGGKVTTFVYEQAETEESMEAAIENAASEGCSVIFTTASRMIGASVRCAIRHPELKIYNCSVKMSYSSICTYDARIYEAKFLMGAIAAAMSKSGRLGYVAYCPIYGTLANINAFALGARMINPYAKVYLEWSGVKGADPAAVFEKEGITYISGDDMITPSHASREYGLYVKEEGKETKNLGVPILHWGKFYEHIVRSAFRGGGEEEALKGRKAVNYWWGLSADVIDVIYSGDMPHELRRLIEFLKESIRLGSFLPFSGVIYDQDKRLRCGEKESLEAEQIIAMDWLAENVSGKIPDMDELTEGARELARLQGVQLNEQGIRGEVTV